MKYPVALEIREKFQYPASTPEYAPNIIYDTKRLTTAYPRPDSSPGSDRQVCRTVNGILRVNLLRPDVWSGRATAALMGAYGGKTGVIQDHTTGPTTLNLAPVVLIDGKNPLSVYDFEYGFYTAAGMSAGGYGFDLFSSYSNLMEEIFIRLEIAAVPVNGRFFEPAAFEISAVLLAGDPA